MSNKITKEHAEEMGFAALVLHARQALAHVPEYANIKDNSAFLRVVIKQQEIGNTVGVIKELQKYDMLATEDGATVQASAPVTVPAVATPVVAPAIQPEAPVVHRVEPPVQQPPAESPNADAGMHKALASLNALGDVFVDGGQLRMADGSYVCAFCIEEGKMPADVIRTASTKGIGGHASKHGAKHLRSRVNIDNLMKSLPAYVEVGAAAAESAPAEPTAAPVAEQQVVPTPEQAAHTTLDEGHIIETPAVASLNAPATPVARPQDPHVAADVNALRVELHHALETMEVNLVTALITILTMPPDAQKYLFDNYAKKRSGVVSEILMKAKDMA